MLKWTYFKHSLLANMQRAFGRHRIYQVQNLTSCKIPALFFPSLIEAPRTISYFVFSFRWMQVSIWNRKRQEECSFVSRNNPALTITSDCWLCRRHLSHSPVPGPTVKVTLLSTAISKTAKFEGTWSVTNWRSSAFSTDVTCPRT